MSNYFSGTIQKGSKGDEVRTWQDFLVSQGYKLDVDGDFGYRTHEATKNWQSKNGLSIDGIVGNNSWSKAGFTNINTPTAPPTISAAPTGPSFNTTNFSDTTEGQGKKTAMDTALENFNNYGPHTWGNQTIYDGLLNDYLNREDFSYDLNGDALYQQYKDKFIQQGKMAMQDTMGQASAMTGGYGSSYAQSAGQQAYQNSLDNLNDIVPELYQMAYNRYNQEGADMLNQLGVLDSDYNRSFGEWQAGYGQLKDKYSIANDDYYNSEGSYNTNRDKANTLAQKTYENEFNAWDVGNQNAWKQWDAEEGIRRWEKEYDLKKNSMNSGGDSGGYGMKNPTVTNIDPGPEPIKATSSERTTAFINGLQTKEEFYQGRNGGKEKQKYGTYEAYVDAMLDSVVKNYPNITEGEVAYLISYFGL